MTSRWRAVRSSSGRVGVVAPDPPEVRRDAGRLVLAHLVRDRLVGADQRHRGAAVVYLRVTRPDGVVGDPFETLGQIGCSEGNDVQTRVLLVCDAVPLVDEPGLPSQRQESFDTHRFQLPVRDADLGPAHTDRSAVTPGGPGWR